jgi:hypothetical protein
MNRIEQLKSLLETDTKDPFLYYCLALEYAKNNEIDAKYYFDLLFKKFPDYLPSYFHAAEFYKNIDSKKAVELYNKGILVAQKQSNLKTLAELKNALLNYEIELE